MVVTKLASANLHFDEAMSEDPRNPVNPSGGAGDSLESKRSTQARSSKDAALLEAIRAVVRENRDATNAHVRAAGVRGGQGDLAAALKAIQVELGIRKRHHLDTLSTQYQRFIPLLQLVSEPPPLDLTRTLPDDLMARFDGGLRQAGEAMKEIAAQMHCAAVAWMDEKGAEMNAHIAAADKRVVELDSFTQQIEGDLIQARSALESMTARAEADKTSLQRRIDSMDHRDDLAQREIARLASDLASALKSAERESDRATGVEQALRTAREAGATAEALASERLGQIQVLTARVATLETERASSLERLEQHVVKEGDVRLANARISELEREVRGLRTTPEQRATAGTSSPARRD